MVHVHAEQDCKIKPQFYYALSTQCRTFMDPVEEQNTIGQTISPKQHFEAVNNKQTR